MRKLAVCSSAFSAAIFCCVYLLKPTWLFQILIIAAVAFVLLHIIKSNYSKHLKLLILFFAFGTMCYKLNYEMKIVPAQLLDGHTSCFSAEVLSYPVDTERCVRAEVRFHSDGYPSLNALYYDYSGALIEAVPGDTISGVATVRYSGVQYGNDYDYYVSDGIFLICTGKTEISVSQNDNIFANSFTQSIKIQITEIIQEVFSEDVRAFFQALLLGDKQLLYNDDELYVDMSRAGFMHVVAVSGMHVSFLVGAAQLIIGKRPRDSFICICLVWSFVLVTGASKSAERAAIMQTVMLLAPVFRRENDPFTSLSLALAIILLFNPFSASSISLQLSFSAVAGIYLFSDKLCAFLMDEAKTELLKKIIKYPVGILSASVGVMVFSIPLTAIHFGYISVLSVLTNILGIWAISICFCGGYCACLATFFSLPLGKILALLVSIPARYVAWLVGLISDINWSVIYFSDVYAWIWLFIVYLLSAVIIVLKVSPRIKIAASLVCCTTAIIVMPVLTDFLHSRYTSEFTVIDVGQGLCAVAYSGETTVVVDCGSIFTNNNAGDVAGKYLLGDNRTTVNLLVLTHLDSDHVNGVKRLCEYLRIQTIVLSPPCDENDGFYFDEILQCAASKGITLFYLQNDTIFEYPGLTVLLYPEMISSNSNDNSIFVELKSSDNSMLISGDSSAERELKFVEKHKLSDIDYLIVGHHGSKYSSCDEFLAAIGGTTAIISVGYNTYGHPTTETIERLMKNGFEVLRTDIDGNITLKAG